MAADPAALPPLPRTMLLGAGLGTRLRPLTDRVPKVLAPVLGVPMLDRLCAYLARQGVQEAALNTHHLAEAVRAHLDGSRPDSGLPIPQLFHEPELLGTGGALVNARDFWGDKPLLVWNTDILCDLEPRGLVDALEAAPEALGVLAVQSRPTDSALLVDRAGYLCGIDSPRRGVQRVVRTPQGAVEPCAYTGICLLRPELRGALPVKGAFELMSALLDAVQAGVDLRAWDAGSAAYGTTGSPERIAELEALLRSDLELRARWTP